MGQGLSAGVLTGVMADMVCAGMVDHNLTLLKILAATSLCGLSVDLASDLTARTGKLNVEREVVLNAADSLKHVYTFYATNEAHSVSKLVRQKHEWLVLESHTHRFYTVQKWPATGDIGITVCSTMRGANDWGLRAACRPTHMGETRQLRQDMDFDVPDELQVAYVIAWLRKEDPRWSFSTENSKHFAMRLRFALHDF